MNFNKSFTRYGLLLIAMLSLAVLAATSMQTNEDQNSFTYIGQLSQKGIPFSGSADIIFTLWDAREGGSTVSTTQRMKNITIKDGVFKVPLAFDDSALVKNATRWLEVSVRAPAGRGSFTTLSPRREVARSGSLDGNSNNNRFDNGNENIQLLAPDWFINAPNSIYLNIDTDNNTDTAVLEIAKHRSGDTGGTSLLKVQEDGKVGIGTTTPTEMLSVAGMIESLSGGIKFPDLTVQVTAFNGTIDWADILNIPAGFADGIDDGSFIWQGIWVSTEDYAIDDVVFQIGSSYIAIAANTNEPPYANPQSWSMMAQQGTNGDDALWQVSGSTMYYNGGRVGVGTNTPGFPFHVATSTATTAIYGEHISAAGSVWGIQGSSASDGGIGVYGFTTNASGNARGGYFASQSSDGGGVDAVTSSPNGASYGVRGRATGRNGTGVIGQHSSSSGTAPGVMGETSSTSGSAFGVYGLVKSTSPGGYSAGVRGENKGTGGAGIGVWASHDGSGWGVFGTSVSGIGVYGYASTNSGINYGVYGRSASPDGYAGYFAGGRNYFSGNVGIGTETPNYALQIETSGIRAISAVTSNSTSSTYAIFGYTNASTGNNTYGVYGASASTTGRGLYGYSTSNSGTNYGVFGNSRSGSGYDFYAGGAGIDYGSPSSRRWKNNIVPIDEPLNKIAQLRGVYFDWDEEHGGKHDIGMISEEVGAVLPEIVIYEENGIDAHGMDYSKMTPLLVEAVNALRDEKDAEIADLKSRLAQLEAMMNQLLNTKEEEE